jgi:hypothetical protein
VALGERDRSAALALRPCPGEWILRSPTISIVQPIQELSMGLEKINHIEYRDIRAKGAVVGLTVKRVLYHDQIT